VFLIFQPGEDLQIDRKSPDLQKDTRIAAVANEDQIYSARASGKKDER